jgi:dTDP-4-amino-4,6-dideoxygalactose transaminase
MSNSTSYIPFNQSDLTYLLKIGDWDTSALTHTSGDGPYTRLCEELLTAELGAASTLLTTSCTSALEMSALLLKGIRGTGEIIVPSFTFVSTASAFLLHGFRPVFVDVDPHTLNLDPHEIEKAISKETKAICVVHYGGIACEMEPIIEIAEQYDLMLIEDNAHGLFGRYNDRPLGSFGDLATLSFHETKNFSCGEGGALMLNNPMLVDRAHILREKGTNRRAFKDRVVDKYTWVDVGSSWVMSDILARILYPQLVDRDRINGRRLEIFWEYGKKLGPWAEKFGFALPVVPDHSKPTGHLFHLRLRDFAMRQRFIEHMRMCAINVVFHYQALNKSPIGQSIGGVTRECPVAEEASNTLVRLPLYSSLTEDEVSRIINAASSFRP